MLRIYNGYAMRLQLGSEQDAMHSVQNKDSKELHLFRLSRTYSNCSSRFYLFTSPFFRNNGFFNVAIQELFKVDGTSMAQENLIPACICKLSFKNLKSNLQKVIRNNSMKIYREAD